MCSVCARYYIRVYIQKQFSSDDGILLFGVACLVVAIGLLLKFADNMYIVGSQESGDLIGVPLPSDYFRASLRFSEACHYCSHLDVVDDCVCQIQLPVSFQKAYRKDAEVDCILVVRSRLQRADIDLWCYRIWC